MRWFISRNGAIDGPYPERDIRRWVADRQVGPEASVRAEFDPVPDRWTLVRESKFERLLPLDQRLPEKKRRQLITQVVAVAVPLCLVGTCGALVALGDKAQPTTEPATVADSKPVLCQGEPRVETLEVWACTDVGTRDGRIELRDAEGNERGVVSPPTSIELLSDSETGPREIRRKPGHVDQKVCILDGPSAGRVVYLQNTAVFAHPCTL